MGFDLNAFSAQRDKERKKKTQTSASLVDIGSIESELSSIREERLKEEQKALDAKLSPRERKLKTQEKRLNENYGATQSNFFKAATAEQSALQNAGGSLTSLDQIGKDSSGFSFADYGELLNYSSWLSDTDRRAYYNLNKDRSGALQKEIDSLTKKAKTQWSKLTYEQKVELIDKNRAANGKNAVSFVESLALSDKDKQALSVLMSTKSGLDKANSNYDKYGNAAGLSNEEIEKLKDAAYEKGDTEAYFYYDSLKGKKEMWDTLSVLYDTKMSGKSTSIAEEAIKVAGLPEGEAKEKQIEDLKKEFKKAGVDFDTYYALLVGEEAGLEFFKESEGNALEATGATVADAAMSFGRGVGNFGEGVLDTVGYGIANVADLFGDEFAGKARIVAGTDYVNNWLTSDTIQRYSVLGRTSRSILEGTGQVAAMIGLSYLGGAAGLAPGAASTLTTGTLAASSVGSATGEAFKSGASAEEATAYGLMSGAVETMSEMLFQGLGKGLNIKGLSSLDDIVASKMSSVFKKPAMKNIVQYAIKSGAEGFEEVIAGFGNAVAKKLTYMNEEDIEKLLEDESLFESFVVGSFTSSIAQGKDLVKSVKSGKDFVSGLTKTEKTALDGLLKKRVEEAEKDGEKIDSKEKAKLYDDLVKAMDRGELSINEIEEVLGEEAKKKLDELSEKEAKDKAEFAEHYEGEELKKRIEEYDAASERAKLEAELSNEVFEKVKDTRLAETYREQYRVGQTFTVNEEDLEKMDSKRADAYRRAMEDGIVSNTRKAHDLVDITSKIEAEKGVRIDLYDTKKLAEMGFNPKDVFVNGVTHKGGVAINVQSKKALNSIVGHELVHVLRGNQKQYETLRDVAIELAKTRGEYDSRWKQIDALYRGKKGYNGKLTEELVADIVGDYLFSDPEFIQRLSVKDRNLFQRIWDEVKYLFNLATAGSEEARQLEKLKRAFEDVYRGETNTPSKVETKNTLSEIGVEVDEKTKTVYSLSSLNDAFNVEKGVDEYVKARSEYEEALAKSIAEDPNNVTKEELDKAKRYLDSLFLVGETIANDRERLDYEAAVKKSAWVSNAEYGGSIDFSTLCAKRRVFTGTFDAIQEALPDTVLTENDFLTIRNLLLESGEEAPCSMCYVEGSRAKHGVQVAKFLAEYLKTNPDWKPQIADFASASRLEQTRIQHPEAYAKYQEAMNKLAQSKPKEASVRTDYKGEILKAFVNAKGEVDLESVLRKNLNGGIRFNSFSDFEIIHALDCMQVLMDMSRVGLSGQAYTKVKEFAEAFGETRLKINLSLVAKGVDENGNLLFDEINGMKHSDAVDLRNRYSENVGTVIVVFDEAQMKAALADPQIDYVLPFHRSQWKRAQYDAMGLPSSTKDFTAHQNDKVKNPKTGKWVNLGKIKHVATYTNDLTGETHKITGNIMPNQYWDYNSDGRTNAQRYLDYINSNGLAPKFRFLLDNVNGKWVLPEGKVGDNYFKLLIDFKMYNNKGWGSPQTPVSPDYNMPYIQQMLKDYSGGHNVFPVAQDVVKKFVDGKKSGKYKAYPETFTPKRVAPKVNLPGTIAAPTFSLSKNGATQKRYGDLNISGEDVRLQAAEAVGLPYDSRYGEDIARMVEKQLGISPAEPADAISTEEANPKPVAEPTKEKNAPVRKPPKKIPGTTISIAPEDGNTEAPPVDGEERSWIPTSSESDAVNGFVKPEDIPDGFRYYQPLSNKKVLESANGKLNKDGYDKSLAGFKHKMEDSSVSVEDIVLGERLLQEAVKKGDFKTSTELMVDIAVLGTELGRMVQALSIIKRLSPEGQLMTLTRIVERGKRNKKTQKIFKGVEVTPEIQELINSVKNEDGTYDQEKLNEVMEEAKQKIADQMGVTAMERMDAWRYFAMLGNPKTHIRNGFSNAANFAMRIGKNAVQRTVEDLSSKGLNKMKPETKTDEKMGPYHVRTRTWARPSSVVKEFAKKTTLEEKDTIAGSGYSDVQDIKQKRKMFPGIIQKAYKFNMDTLEVEDSWFSRPTYRFALAEYLTANGIRTQEDIDNNKELVAKAKAFALEEALTATFRQDSALANWISSLENMNRFSKLSVGAVLPFKKTPVNIAKAGVSYSPIGFAKGLVDVVRSAKSKGESVDMTKAIDEVAQGLTGSALAMIGLGLAAMGILKGAGEEDKEAKYDYQLGEQSYSIKIGDDTFSLSWLTPVSMPLFVGANVYESIVEDQEMDWNVAADALLKTLDPLTELSFISGLTDTISSYENSSSGLVGGMFASAFSSYVTQYFPTLFSQIAQFSDDTKRSTKPSKDSSFSGFEEFMNKVAYKVPLWRNSLEPTTDIWGNEVKQATGVEGFAQAFVHPWNPKYDISTDIDDEIKDLYNQTGENSVLPKIPYNYTNYEGVKYEMSAAEHTEYKKTYGQTAYDMLSKLFKTDTYKNGDNKLRQSMVEAVYEYAGETAKVQFFKGRDLNYTNAKDDNGNKIYKENAILGAVKHDMTMDEYRFYAKYPKKYKFLEESGLSYKAYEAANEDEKRGYSWAYDNQEKYAASKLVTEDFEEFYTYKAALNKISAGNQTKAQKAAYISGLDLDAAGKMILFRMEYPNDDTYNRQIVSYVNASGLTYSEKVAVLNGLGISVGANGAISW